MAIRNDSYSSVSDVTPYVRYRLKGGEFSADSLPTEAEVERFIDRASGVLNIALAGAGFSTPFNSTTATSTAVLMVDDFVTDAVVQMIERANPGVGVNDSGNKRGATLDLYGMAEKWVKNASLALKRAGATVEKPSHEGLTFTGLKVQSSRSDPDNTARAQPKFSRGLFDNA